MKERDRGERGERDRRAERGGQGEISWLALPASFDQLSMQSKLPSLAGGTS